MSALRDIDGPSLKQTDQGLALVMGKMELHGDYARMLPRLRSDRLAHELLVRAAKVKPADGGPLRAVDATAGLGEDALLLAAAGFSVRLFERNAVIAALLRDTMERASRIPELVETVSRMEVSEADSVDALRSLDFEPDVVLLDPMFPQKGKDAAAKKKLQMFQQLECPCDDEGTLFEAAIAASPRKIVVKRPVKGPLLAGRKPDYSLEGKAIRYDCYVFAR